MSTPINLAKSNTTVASSTNSVLRNTYWLLSLTLLFSLVTAAVGMASEIVVPWFISLIVSLGLLFAVHKTADSATGIALVFAFTGWMGFTLGPILNFTLGLPGGGSILMQTVALTGTVFLALSAYAVTTRKDFSFMSGFLLAGLIILIVGGLLNLFIESSALQLALACAGALIFSALILLDTSRIVNGGETNYIRATVSLYLDVYNLFIYLLQLVMSFSGNDD